MGEVAFEIRNMETQQQGVAEFADVEAARQWLAERPQFVEVLGPVQQDLDPLVEKSLRQAMRPLDDAELAKRRELDEEREAARKAELELMNRQAWAESQPISMSGDPSAMVLKWQRGKGLEVEGDPGRRIPADLAAAALEWIRERDRWVHPRKQHVARATLAILPASAGDAAERIADTSQFATMPGFSDHEIGQ